jgi:hypothetical protein
MSHRDCFARGVVYGVTHSNVYLEAALMSAIALRSLNPHLPITLISNQPLLEQLPLDRHNITARWLGPQEFGEDDVFGSRLLKTRLVSLSPYQETLFLDADILPLRSVLPLWDYLAEADFAMACDRLPTVALCDHVAAPEKTYTLQQVSGMTPQFNSGVMIWRRNASVEALFAAWEQQWKLFQKQDQLALVRAIHQTQTQVRVLPKTYNISPIDAVPLQAAGEAVQLLHCWGGMVGSGEFRELLRGYYPEVVDEVDRLCRVG